MMIAGLLAGALGAQNYATTPMLREGEHNYTIAVACHCEFHGSVLISRGGQSTSTSFQGQLHGDYFGTGTFTAVTFQKSSKNSGAMAVVIARDGTVVSSQTTTADYGVVSLSAK